jgi:hypothetical protein
MRQFIDGSDAAFAELQQQATGACVQFHDQELPPGAEPRRARIGFEVRSDGTASLLVERGVSYSGPDAEVRAWFASGERLFSDAKLLEAPLGRAASRVERALVGSLGPIDLLIGGPPCQGHSDLNNRTRRSDPKNRLYDRMARFA